MFISQEKDHNIYKDIMKLKPPKTQNFQLENMEYKET